MIVCAVKGMVGVGGACWPRGGSVALPAVLLPGHAEPQGLTGSGGTGCPSTRPAPWQPTEREGAAVRLGSVSSI